MTNPAHFSTKIACVALLCVCAILLAWAAPVLLRSGDTLEFLRRAQSQPANDPVELPAETDDTSDEPVMFASNSKTGLHPVTFAFQTYRLPDRTWSPTAPVRPPILSTQSDPAAA